VTLQRAHKRASAHWFAAPRIALRTAGYETATIWLMELDSAMRGDSLRRHRAVSRRGTVHDAHGEGAGAEAGASA
jgi:hypothetical protein